MVALKTYITEIKEDMEYLFRTDDAPKAHYGKGDELAYAIQLLSCGCFHKNKCASGSISNVDYEDEMLRRVTSWLSREDYSQAGTSNLSRGTLGDEFNESFIETPTSQIGRGRRRVSFDYPPITSIRQRPRTTSRERKTLFFSEDELDEMDEDRSTLVDDVEVTVIENISAAPAQSQLEPVFETETATVFINSTPEKVRRSSVLEIVASDEPHTSR